jgi:four helix bundle protein
MATWRSFEAMDVWKMGCRLVIDVYRAMGEGQGRRDFALRDQIRKSALSIPSNIAEGFERESPSAFIPFLYYSKGSCGELRTQLYIAAKLGYIDRARLKDLVRQAKDISRMLSGLIKYLKKRRQEGNRFSPAANIQVSSLQHVTSSEASDE